MGRLAGQVKLRTLKGATGLGRKPFAESLGSPGTGRALFFWDWKEGSGSFALSAPGLR